MDERILSLLDRLGSPLVFVPPGEFQMGSDKGRDQQTFDIETPMHQVCFEGYWIGKFPVTNTEFERFVKETGYQAQGNWRSEFGPGKERHPVVNATWHESLAFCRWAGVTLPSEAEWEKAARGTDGRIYPWGNLFDAGLCNVTGGGTTPVGEYQGGVSPHGCYDMSGNVLEWTRSLDIRYPYNPADGREDLESSGIRVLRGGSFLNIGRDVRCATRLRKLPGHRSGNIGFRVAVSPLFLSSEL